MNRATASDKYSAAAGLASAVEGCAATYGIDIKPICRALDLDPSTFSDPAGRISLDRLCRLLETCSLIANDEAFGLRCIDHFRPGASGPLGYGLMVAPTALDFFRFLGENQQSGAEKSYSKFTINDSGAEIASTYSPLIVKRDQFVDMGVGLVMARLRPILGNAIDLVEIGLERKKPKNLAIFKERISKKISFDRRINTYRLPSELFGHVNPKADPQLFRLMELQCRIMAPTQRDNQDFPDELKEFLMTRISEANVSLVEAAAYFHVSERTLQRRLSEAHTSLNDLRDEVRRDLAEKLLAESELSAAEIALRLGYSAPSAFTRSTMRWFGKTPRELRKA